MGDWLSWLEHRLCKPGVVGSSPTFSTTADASPRGSLTGWKESRHKSKTSESKQLAVAREGGGTTIELEREASKGVRRMPWLPEAKKDAAGRESLRGGANGR